MKKCNDSNNLITYLLEKIRRINFKKILLILVVIGIIIISKKYIEKCVNLSVSNKIEYMSENSYTKYLNQPSYSMEFLVTYYANNQKDEYKLIDKYIDKDEISFEKLIYQEPKKFEGMSIDVTDNEIVHMNPYIQKNITYYTEHEKNYNNLLFSSFARNFLNDKESQIQENKKEYILKCTIPGDNYHFKYQECNINKENNNPTKMTIYSKDKVKVCDISILNIMPYEEEVEKEEVQKVINEETIKEMSSGKSE